LAEVAWSVTVAGVNVKYREIMEVSLWYISAWTEVQLEKLSSKVTAFRIQ